MSVTLELSATDRVSDDLDLVAANLDALATLLCESSAAGSWTLGLSMLLHMHSQIIEQLAEQLRPAGQ